MVDVKDFNYDKHRVESASAVFQKSIYHLFVLNNGKATDVYEQVIRTYQCLFLLCLTQLLLDMNFPISSKNIQPRLKQLCINPQEPTRREIDPSALINHSVFENGNWKGFPNDHPLEASSKNTLNLYKKSVESRHNMIYRPFLLDKLGSNHWEDCTLIDLISSLPEPQTVETVFVNFLEGIIEWRKIEDKAPRQSIGGNGTKKIYAHYFLQKLFIPYKDDKGTRPTETLYMTYARMLNPDDENFIELAKEYRNKLLDVTTLISYTSVFDEWKPGEL